MQVEYVNVPVRVVGSDPSTQSGRGTFARRSGGPRTGPPGTGAAWTWCGARSVRRASTTTPSWSSLGNLAWHCRSQVSLSSIGEEGGHAEARHGRKEVSQGVHGGDGR